MTAEHPPPEDSNVVQRIVNAWDCCGTCAGGVLAAYVADRLAAVQAERCERAKWCRDAMGLGKRLMTAEAERDAARAALDYVERHIEGDAFPQPSHVPLREDNGYLSVTTLRHRIKEARAALGGQS